MLERKSWRLEAAKAYPIFYWYQDKGLDHLKHKETLNWEHFSIWCLTDKHLHAAYIKAKGIIDQHGFCSLEIPALILG